MKKYLSVFSSSVTAILALRATKLVDDTHGFSAMKAKKSVFCFPTSLPSLNAYPTPQCVPDLKLTRHSPIQILFELYHIVECLIE